MNIFPAIKKIFNYPQDKILNMSINEFYNKMTKYQFSYEEVVIILGIILNKTVINETKTHLNLLAQNDQEDVIIDFAVFAYVFIGDEYNDTLAIKDLKIDLTQSQSDLFALTLNTLINNYTRNLELTDALGSDNDRANMFAVNALLNIKRGLGFDNFHITLFAIYQSLELKLKNCLKKYISSEPSAYKKQINFHNLVRLIKLISTSRVEDQELADILKDLREYLRYFEKINPGGQAARYEAAPNTKYFTENSYSAINEKQLLQNFVHALNLLQSLYLKLVEIYDSTHLGVENFENSNIDKKLVALIGAKDDDDDNQINNKLRNLLDQQIFGDYQELVNLSYNELIILRFLLRIGFVQYVNQAVDQLVKK